MNKPMELDIWKGDWGLPSVDLACLQVMAYARFSGVPLKVIETDNPFHTPTGTLPVFRHGKKQITTFQEITAYLRKKNFSADFGLTPKQCAEVAAYVQLLQEKLYPGLQYIWWVDIKNYLELSRPWYAKAIPFPFNYYYPGSYERNAKRMMEALYGDAEPAAIETYVYAEAEKCLTAISTRLGDSDFFFGSYPTSLDAVVYAYLAPLLKVPFSSPALQNHLKGCNNLVKFVVRISQRYFPTTCQQYESKKSKEDSKKGKNNDDADFPHKRRNQIWAGVFATLAMTSYAFLTGIVQILVKEGGKSDDITEVEYADVFESARSSEN